MKTKALQQQDGSVCFLKTWLTIAGILLKESTGSSNMSLFI